MGTKESFRKGVCTGPTHSHTHKKPALGTCLKVQMHGQEDAGGLSFLLLSLSTPGPL